MAKKGKEKTNYRESANKKAEMDQLVDTSAKLELEIWKLREKPYGYTESNAEIKKRRAKIATYRTDYQNISKKTDEGAGKAFDRQVKRAFSDLLESQAGNENASATVDSMVGSSAPSSSSEVVEETIDNLSDLKSQMDAYFTKNERPAMVVQRLVEYGLSPYDLTSGPNQGVAITVALTAHPAAATMLKSYLQGNEWEQQEAKKILNKLANGLEDAYQVTREAQADRADIESSTVVGAAESSFKRLGSEVAKHPGQALIYSALLAGGMALIYKYGKEHSSGWLGKIAKGIAGVGIIGGSLAGVALGTNWITRKLSKDQIGWMDKMAYHPDILTESDTLFAGYIADMLPNDAAARRDLNRISASPVSVAISHFQDALNAQSGTINPRVFRGNGVNNDSITQLNGTSTYNAIKALVLTAAKKTSVSPNASEDHKLHVGLEYMRYEYASGGNDWAIQAVINDLFGIKRPANQLANGMDADAEPLGMLRSQLNSIDKKQANRLDALLSRFHDLDISVEQRTPNGSTQRLAIQGYVFEYSYDKGRKNAHVFIDPLNGRELGISVGSDQNTLDKARALKDYAEQSMKTLFNDGIRKAPGNKALLDKLATGPPPTTVTIKFNKDKKIWELQPTLRTKAYAGMGNSGEEIPVIIYYHEDDTGLRLHVNGKGNKQGDMIRYNDFEEIQDAYSEDIDVHKRLKADLVLSIGNMPFEVESAVDSGSTTTIKIKYGNGTIGTIVYFGKKIDESASVLPQDDALDSAREALIRERTASLMSGLKMDRGGEYQKLLHSYQGHLHGATFSDEVAQLYGRGEEVASRVLGGEDTLTADAEAIFQENMDYKVKEYAYIISRRNMEAYSVGGVDQVIPDFELKEKTLLLELNEQFQRIRLEIDTELSGKTGSDKGNAINKKYLEEAKDIEMVGYKSPDFVMFITQVEVEMSRFDFIGKENWAYARGLRDDARIAIVEMCWPLQRENPISAKGMIYFRDILRELRTALSVAQGNREGSYNISGITLDDRVRDITAQFKAQGVLPYEKFNSSVYAGAPPSSAPTTYGLSSGPGSTGGGVEAISAKIREAGEELDDIYKPVDALEFSLFDDVFDAFIGYRKKLLHDEMIVMVNATPINADTIIKTYLERARMEVIKYQSFNRLEDTNNTVALTNAMEIMSSDIVLNSDVWSGQSKKVMKWYLGNFEFENYAFIDNPNIFIDLMDHYYERIGYGSATTGNLDDRLVKIDPLMADNYTKYFLYSMSKLLPGDSNWAVNNFPSGKIRHMNNDEWIALQNRLDQIMDYQEWMDKGMPPYTDLLENNIDYGMEEGIERDKAKERKKFVDWFDDEMELSEWTRIDGSWPEVFRQHAMRRMLVDISPIAATSEQLAKYLQKYKQFLIVEKEFYDWMINAKVEDSGRTSQPLLSIWGIPGGILGGVASGGSPLGIAGGAILASSVAVGIEGAFDTSMGPSLGINYGKRFHDNVRTVIDKEFETHFLNSATKDSDAYAASLKTVLEKMIEKAQRMDDRTYNFGPISIGGFQGIDTVQVSP